MSEIATLLRCNGVEHFKFAHRMDPEGSQLIAQVKVRVLEGRVALVIEQAAFCESCIADWEEYEAGEVIISWEDYALSRWTISYNCVELVFRDKTKWVLTPTDKGLPQLNWYEASL